MLRDFWITSCIIFVALDVIGLLPIFLSMTAKFAPERKKHTINISIIVAFLVAVIFLILGENVFEFLGITIADFRIAGGLVLLLLSLADLAGTSKTQDPNASTGIVPLAVPLITGPGIITSTFLQVQTVGFAITLFAMIANYFLTWIALHYSESVNKFIGKDGTTIFSKLAALMLSAIAVSMMRLGFTEMIHGIMSSSH
jgi:multiple antibiotic resistance protein